MTRLQPIYDIAPLCAEHGLTDVILCPGSRCAPLTVAFARHPAITTRTISDERSAAFIALGIAQQKQQPTVLVCTSGSAAYNFAPAVAEAFYQEVPLLIFTADRPKEWIDQWDGQTIQQNGLFGAHVKKSFTLPEDYDHPDSVWYIQRVVNEAIHLSRSFPQGPVHVNVPLREPLYPAKGEQINYSTPHVITEKETIPSLSPTEKEEILASLKKYTKVLVVAGHQEYNDGLHKVADRFSKKFHAPIIGDVISNFHGLENTIRFSELIVGKANASVLTSLQPELLITIGNSVISKSLKLYLRKHKAVEHWHIQPASRVPDPFQSVSKIIRTTPKQFFEELVIDKLESDFASQKKENYYSLWQAEEHRVQRVHENYFKQVDFHELSVIQQLIHALPIRCNLHLSNSMAVRYANLIGLTSQQKGVHVFANRGTSGIDGCTSTAVGNALVSDIPTILITGDMAFFYDRNAFWHNYPVPNLHVVVVNNHGGIIFGMIDGPSHIAEAEEYFITQQKLTAKNLADEFGFEFTLLDSGKKTKNALKDFFEFGSKTKILELHSDKKSAQEAYTQFNSQIKKGYDA